MHGLSVGNEVLKQLHQEMSLDEVEKLMDQTREGVEYQRVSPPSLHRVLHRVLADYAGNRRDTAVSYEPRRRGGGTSGAGSAAEGSYGELSPAIPSYES
jgi:hypothetical protein